MLWWILGSGGSAREGAITEAAAHIDDYISKRLLDPGDEVVNIADREFWATEGPTCVRMRAALRAVGVKIVGKD
jgi:hypothetical protein